MKNKNCILLLSGGIDSVTLLTKLTNDGYFVYAISFTYGQNHLIEIEYAKKQAKKYNVKEHLIIELDKKIFTGNNLVTNQAIEYKSVNEFPPEISNEYLPARNLIFLSYALSWAEQLNVNEIFIAANKDDFNNFPDCRSDFYKAFEKTANISGLFSEVETKLKVLAPFENLTKTEIVKLGIDLNVDFSNTISCYFPKNGLSCGKCMSCLIRDNAFKMNGLNEI